MAKLAYGLLMIILAICCTTAWAKQEGKMQGGAYSPCDMCRFLVGYVEDLVGQKQSVADIVTACSAMCGLAPREMAAACRGFVSAYVPFLVQYLIDTENPAAACSSVGVCPVDDVVASGDAAVLYVPRSAATDECTLCETVTGFVQSYLYANHTEQEIQEGLDALCSLLPDSQQCTTMVDQYLAAIYMFLRSYANPHLVCAEIKLCSQK